MLRFVKCCGGEVTCGTVLAMLVTGVMTIVI